MSCKRRTKEERKSFLFKEFPPTHKKKKKKKKKKTLTTNNNDSINRNEFYLTKFIPDTKCYAVDIQINSLYL